jgi:Protein of unknown function (DUF3082)
MSEEKSTQNQNLSDNSLEKSPEKSQDITSTPQRCLTGSLVSGAMAFAAYSLMISIATKFAAKPMTSDNQIVLRISSAVRTLVVGIVALGAGVFGLVSVGLFALMLQLILQRISKQKESQG